MDWHDAEYTLPTRSGTAGAEPDAQGGGGASRPWTGPAAVALSLVHGSVHPQTQNRRDRVFLLDPDARHGVSTPRGQPWDRRGGLAVQKDTWASPR